MDKTREKALNIALNKITGAWDDALLADLLKDLGDDGFNLEFTGFDAPEIEQLFSNIYDKQVKEDDFDVDSELKQPVFSKPGDLWHLGRHSVICGDSTKPEAYALLIKGATGGTGPAGADAITMSITSSNGTIFKNTGVSTTLTAHVYKAGVELNATQIAAFSL